ncbi:MAG: apolipoprotein N-acyltransferase, partial [Rubrivivax sp.]
MPFKVLKAGRPERAALAWALLAMAGAGQTLACVHTGLWWLAPLAVAVLVAQLREASPLQAALAGLVFGTAWLLAAVWWLFISMHRYGGLPAGLAAAAVVLLALALSIYLALACAAWARLRTGVASLDALSFAACWLLAEWARAVIFTGFPWAASGYTQIDAPLAALAPWVGVYGVGALVALASALLGLAWARMRRRLGQAVALGFAALAVLLLPALTGTPEFTRTAGTQTVTLLQTAVPQDEKFSGERLPQNLGWLAQALAQAQGQLVVAPETAVPLLPFQLAELAPGWWPGVVERFARSSQVGLLGLPLGSFDDGYTNSAVGLYAAASAASSPRGSAGPHTWAAAGAASRPASQPAPGPGSEPGSGPGAEPGAAAPYRYDKVHLVPFGEFIPTGFRWFTNLMNIPLGDFSRGPLDAPSLVAGSQRIAPNICYEDLFGEELAVRFRDPSRAPTVLVNLSNIGWFGDTIALPQHLNISRMRSLELQRPMLRATNTGVTAIIDHRGRVTHRLAPFVRGALESAYEGRIGTTPFAWWAGRWGLWPLFGLALMVLALAAATKRWLRQP